jgi:hypothetical protein
MRKRAGTFMLILSATVVPLWPTAAVAQGTADTARSQSESGLTLSAEVFCSETKLRTANMRLQWSLSPAARSAAKLTALADAKQTLDATVYAGGFEKGLYVSLPVPSGAVLRPVAPVVAPAAAQARQTPTRAFQIHLIEAGTARNTTAAVDSAPFTAVVEDLEPGVNYTWRLTIETPGGRVVSAPVMMQAPTCPADMVEPKKAPTPTKKPPARGGR